MTFNPHKIMLTEDQCEVLKIQVEQLGLQPLLITETGSKAWGTDTPSSDHDFTVVAYDVDYDYFRWPRDSFSGKLNFLGQECDVRYFSPQKFLRKLARSELVAYETVYTPYGYLDSSEKWRDLFQNVVANVFDAREMYRSVIGSMQSVKHESEHKRRRQQFRYMFVALQLIDFLENIESLQLPYVHIEQYREFAKDAGNYEAIFRLYDWAMAEDPTNTERMSAEAMQKMLIAFKYPKVVEYKQDQHREFLSKTLARLMGQPQTWAEMCEAVEK